MEITKTSVNEWLENERRSQSWLAEKCAVSKQAVSNWLRKNNPQAISAAAQITIRALMEEDAAASQARPPHNIVLEFSDDQYSAIEQAALVRPESVREWAKRTLNDAASVNIEELAADLLRANLPAFQREASIVSFPEVPFLRAAAGFPILADAEMIQPDRALGPGRFILELRGDSMEPRFKDRQRIILRDKASLKRPVLKYGELYCFVHNGHAAFKLWAKDASGNKVLRSLNAIDHPDIAADEETNWIGWYDPADNGWPWANYAVWDEHDEHWSVATLQASPMANGKLNSWIETETEQRSALKRWMPLPIPPVVKR